MSSKAVNVHNLSTMAVIGDLDYQELVRKWPATKFAEMRISNEMERSKQLNEIKQNVQFIKCFRQETKCCHEHMIASFGVLKECIKC